MIIGTRGVISKAFMYVDVPHSAVREDGPASDIMHDVVVYLNVGKALLPIATPSDVVGVYIYESSGVRNVEYAISPDFEVMWCRSNVYDVTPLGRPPW